MTIQAKEADVLILCGGRGKRLRKVSGKTPKSLVEIGRRSFLDILIDFLAHHGFKRILLGIGYNARYFKLHYQHRENDKAKIILIEEKKPLGTGGALKHAQRYIKSKLFMVVNGDSFSSFDPKKFISFHKKKGSLATILLHRAADGRDYGKVDIDNNLKVLNFCEKNKKTKQSLVNAGYYIFNRKIFRFLPAKRKFSLEYDFFPKLIGRGLFGFPSKGFFIDIGTPNRLQEARRYFLRKIK